MGSAGGDLLDPFYLWDHIRIPKKREVFKTKRKDSLPRRSLRKILRWEAGSSGAPSRGTDITSEPNAEVSTKGRDEPVVRNLPEVTSRTSFLGVTSSDTPLQEARGSSTPAEGEGLGHLASGAAGLHLVRTKLSGCAKWKLKKAKASQAGTEGIQQPGIVGMPTQGQTPTGTSKRPRPAGSTPTERVRPPRRPGDI
jgi:hypothetical protein